jgi:hypothetical protein
MKISINKKEKAMSKRKTLTILWAITLTIVSGIFIKQLTETKVVYCDADMAVISGDVNTVWETAKTWCHGDSTTNMVDVILNMESNKNLDVSKLHLGAVVFLPTLREKADN